ncbi:unnamed protein product, partial [Rhizoctonia solani]
MSGSATQPHGGGGTEPVMGTPPNRAEESTKQIDAKGTNIPQEEFDEYGTELGEHARVWKTYVREADKFDTEQVDGWNRSLDVTLIFAALFTAICTAFVIESSKSLKVDAADQLDQITKILLVVANVNDSQLDTTGITASGSFSPRPIDLCINTLWFFSLILSAAVSLIAMLAKEWCYLFVSGRIGDPWSQTKKRQQRWEGIKQWKMEHLIVILPSFIHMAFLSFAVGLCLYLRDLHWGLAVPAACVTLGLILVYVASTLLPLFKKMCPYSTSISRLVQRLRGDSKDSRFTYESHSRIAIEALAWLIRTSEDPKSTDIALQAIAGADPDDKARQLLMKCSANTMIVRRLINLESYSTNYNQILDLYTRAHSFFQPLSTGAPTALSTVLPTDLPTDPPTAPPTQNVAATPANRKLRKNLRKLRGIIDKQITTHADPSHAFLPTPENIQALRIGSTAASYCLRSLQYGVQVQTREQFDSAVELLESYRNRQAHLGTREIQYLMTGTAMLLSSLLVGCPPDMGARYAMRLLRIFGRASSGQNQLQLKHLSLPMAVYALSRYDYPGWTQPPPLSSISRAERAIEMIAHYV